MKTQNKKAPVFVAFLIGIIALAGYTKIQSGDDTATASFAGPMPSGMSATLVSTDSTHRFVTDAQLATLSSGMTVYLNNTLKSNVKMLTQSTTTTTGGAFTFWITNTGASGGTALCANQVYDPSVSLQINDSTNVYSRGWTIASDRKSITGTITRSAPTGVISLLGINILSAPTAVPVGTTVRLTVLCD